MTNGIKKLWSGVSGAESVQSPPTSNCSWGVSLILEMMQPIPGQITLIFHIVLQDFAHCARSFPCAGPVLLHLLYSALCPPEVAFTGLCSWLPCPLALLVLSSGKNWQEVTGKEDNDFRSSALSSLLAEFDSHCCFTGSSCQIQVTGLSPCA